MFELNDILSYSEVWILALPIAILFFKRNQPDYMRPVIAYIWVALLFNSICDGIEVLYDSLPKSFHSNTIFYNCHSLSRFILFSWFFLMVKPQYYRKLYWIIISIFFLLFLIYFSFIDNFFNRNYISSDMMSGEAFFLLCMSMVYYITVLRSDNPRFRNRKDFWVVTGLAIYCVINFFIFLFYKPLLDESITVAINIWEVYNIAFILFILFLSKAIYVPDTDKH